MFYSKLSELFFKLVGNLANFKLLKLTILLVFLSFSIWAPYDCSFKSQIFSSFKTSNVCFEIFSIESTLPFQLRSDGKIRKWILFFLSRKVNEAKRLNNLVLISSCSIPDVCNFPEATWLFFANCSTCSFCFQWRSESCRSLAFLQMSQENSARLSVCHYSQTSLWLSFVNAFYWRRTAWPNKNCKLFTSTGE